MGAGKAGDVDITVLLPVVVRVVLPDVPPAPDIVEFCASSS